MNTLEANRPSPMGGTAPQRCRVTWRVASFAIGCVILLVPIWIVRYPPLLDYPNHLASSFVLAHLHDLRFRFSELYEANWALSPYVAKDATLVMLQRLVSVDAAGRVLLSICVLALPLSVWFFMRQGQAEGNAAVPWAFVLTYNIFFLFGFLEYCLSIAGCFAVLGLWLQYLHRPTTLRWVGLLVAVVALYSVHLFGFAMAGLVMTVYAFAKRQTLKQLGLSWLLFLPGFVLFVKAQMGANAAHHVIVFGGLTRKPAWLLALLEVHPRPAEPVNLVVFALLIMAFVVPLWKNTDRRWNRDWIKVTAVLFALYWLLPGGYEGESFFAVDVRVLPFLFILAFAALDMGRRGRWFATVAIIVFVVRMVSLTELFLVEQPRLDRLARSFDAVPPNAHVVPMVMAWTGKVPSLLFYPSHFWAYGVIQRGWLTPYLFTLQGVQTLRLQAKPYPEVIEVVPETEARLDWETVRRTYDYVWAYRLPRLSSKLRDVGELVFADEGLEVFKMRPGFGGRSTSSPPP